MIVSKAREAGMAGATVLRSPLGYGHSGHIHTEKILLLSEDLPIVIELVDSLEKIEQFAHDIGPLVGSGLINFENVRVLRYGNAAIKAARP